MAFSTTVAINTVLSIISVSLENVIQNLDQFSDLVEELFNHAWLLLREERRFNNSLIRFRAELKSTIPIIKEVEDELAQMRQQLRNLLKKRMDLNADSINNVLILYVLQNEENLLSMDTTTDSAEIEEQKKEMFHRRRRCFINFFSINKSLIKWQRRIARNIFIVLRSFDFFFIR
ncbi:hypothetical protein QL285_057440 [Trifolium repens]|nr:hypothetical protein QL285_057440 [Trifolium repens]